MGCFPCLGSIKVAKIEGFRAFLAPLINKIGVLLTFSLYLALKHLLFQG